MKTIYGGRSVAGRDTLPLSILKGMTPQQHCEKLIAERGGGRFARVSDSEDVCYLPYCGYFGCNPEGAEYSYHYEIHDTPPKIELTSETVFTLPANRQRTTIGVGESVIVSANIPVTWKVQGMSQIDKIDHFSVQFTAPFSLGKVTVNAIALDNNNPSKTSINFNVIEPQDIFYEQGFYQHNPNEAMIYHPKNSISSVVGLWIRALPLTVNFGNVEFMEEDSVSTSTGFLKNDKDYCHINQYAIDGVCPPISEKNGYNSVNSKNNKHNYIGSHDVVGTIVYDKEVSLSKLPDTSDMTNHISIRWRVKGQSQYKLLPKKIKQSFTLHKNGSTFISKGNFSRQFQFSDSFSNGGFLPPDVIK